GSSTGAQSPGTEAVLTPLGQWYVNDTIRCVVSSVAKTSGNTPIGKYNMVLSAHGSADTLLSSSVKPGDTVSVYIGVGGSLPKIRELVGGRPIFYKDGLFDSARAAGTTVMLTRNPRTIVGFSNDSTKCYILVVDGRQTYSVGMDMYEMAKLMRTLKIHHAMNFDGGGSAVMVLNHAIMNKPSDGAERAVSNGLMVISTEPTVIKSATLGLPKYRLFRNDKITFSMTGYDTYNSAITLPNSKIQYSCSSRIGTIDAEGIFTAGSKTDSGYVYAKYGSLSDSSFISVYGLKYFKMSPERLVADTLNTVNFTIDTFDADSVKHNLSLSQFSWTSTNPSVGIVDAYGKFTGLKSGSTYIIAECSGYKDTCFVSVEVGRGTTVLDGLENINGWTFSGDFMDSISVKTSAVEKSQGNASFKIDYKLTYNSQNTYMIYLNKDLPVFGIPDTVYLDVKSDGRRHKLYYLFSDDNGELFRAPGKKYLDNSSLFDRVHAPLSGMIVLSDNAVLNFPLTLKRIELQIAADAVEGQVTAGTIYIDNLRLKYPGEVTAVSHDDELPASYSLSQNYPNPFNPSTVIEFTLPELSRVNLTVYDILGREVLQLLNRQMSAGNHRVSFNAAGLPSGIYICRMQASGNTFARKMLLLR
ncbi:MAG: phosphodiester glycosidase family protein, partial [Syntrophothermus sp.]